MNSSTLVKSSTGNYEVRSLQVGSRIQIHPENLSRRRQYLANATGEITAIKGNKASVLLDEPNKRRTIQIDLCSLRLTSAQEWALVSPSQESLQEDSSCGDCAKLTLFAVTDSAIASQVSESTPMCGNSGLDQEPQISSPLHHHVPHSQLKENLWEAPTQETVFPPSCDKLDSSSPSSQLLKTCLDCYQPPLFPEPNPAHILGRCSGSFSQVGTMQNGLLSEHPSLELSGQEKGSCLLPRPGALSWSGNGRPPGTTKSEAAAKRLGIIQKNEVFNPEWLEVQFGLPLGWTSPQEHRAVSQLLAAVEQHLETVLTPDLQRSLLEESSISTPSSFKAISLWQPWASLIPLGLKHYETRSWKTNYRGRLLICSTTSNPKHYREYLKIKDQLQLPDWDETNFPHGRAIAICDLTDCIQMTVEFIEQQSETEILCGDWQVGRYAWKLENIQPITKPFAVKGKQGLFNIALDQQQTELLKPKTNANVPKSSDCWYTPLHIVDLVNRVLGEIDLDPCADDGKHIHARSHFTAADDGLSREWHGRIFMNPPYSCPGVWMSKLQSEVEAGRVVEAIALVPAATDTNWLSPVLKTQPVCFWKGRIKFLDVNYQPKLPARQSHCLVYWGENWQKFKEVFEEYGFVSLPSQFLGDKPTEKISPRKTLEPIQDEDKSDIQISPTPGDTSQFLGDKLDEQISPRKIGNESEFLGDNPNHEISPKKTRRRKGDGSGSIHWRTVTKKGKDYHEAYYHYELWNQGDAFGGRSHRLTKSTKYIPKRLLAQVQQMEQDKAPVREILGVLGVVV